MAISDGQRVRALESNAAWLSKTADNTAIGKQTLARPASGATVVDVQQSINDINSDIAIIENDITNIESDIATLQSLDTFIYVGQWNATTNSPTIADGDGGATFGVGATYRVGVSGAQDLGSGSIDFLIGDKVVYNTSGIWEKWDVTDEPGQNTKVEYRTLTAGEESAKQITLLETPFATSEVKLDVVGGCAQFYGLDYSVSGTTLSWSGLGLDGLLAENDKVVITYTY